MQALTIGGDDSICDTAAAASATDAPNPTPATTHSSGTTATSSAGTSMVYEEAGRGQKTAQQPDGHEGKAPPVLAPEPQNSIIVSNSSFGLATYAGETSAGALGKLATSCQEESGGDGGSSMAPTVQIPTTATSATSAPAAASATPLSAREEFVIVPASSTISVPADEVRCCALWGRSVVDASRLRAWDSQHTLVRWREPVASADFVLKTWGVRPTRPAVV